MFPSGLFVVHDARTSSEHDEAELSRRQQLDNPLLEISELDVVTRRDDTSLVEAAVELDDDLAVSVVIDFLEFANVACREFVSAML